MKVEDRYEAEQGAEARERQERLARDYLPCCGEHRESGHHIACSKRPDEPERVHDDQASLL